MLTSEYASSTFLCTYFSVFLSSSFILLRANDGMLNTNYRWSKHENTICSFLLFAFLSMCLSHFTHSFPPKPHVFPLSIFHYHILLLHWLLPFLLRLTCRPISIFPFISWNSKADYHVLKNLLQCVDKPTRCITSYKWFYYPLFGSTCFGLSPVHHQEHHLINCITLWYVRAIRRV